MTGPGGGLVLAVLTYRRLDHITELAPELVEQVERLVRELPEVGAGRVLVVDNDPLASAREVLAATPGIDYVHEPRPGISAGRNRALDEAGDADFLVFIDDDERPEPDWLTTLVSTKLATGADAVVGRVRRVFDGPVDPWLLAGGFFPSPDIPTGTRVAAAATNNLLLDLRTVRSAGVRFDDAFGLSGGGDTHFTRALIASGASVVWCNEALVADQVAVERATRKWALQRAYRGGNSDGRVTIALATSRAGRMRARLNSLIRGILRVLGGTSRVIAGRVVRSMALESTGARTAVRGMGMVAAAIGSHFSEYQRVDG